MLYVTVWRLLGRKIKEARTGSSEAGGGAGGGEAGSPVRKKIKSFWSHFVPFFVYTDPWH